EEDPAAADFMIAKFIIQPLVENAVKYSLEKDGVAHVTLRTQVQEERLLICVKDNGIGMSPELVQDLLAEIKTGDSVAILSSEGQSIGLRNVLSRCRLNYGEQFHLGLHSKLGKGTEIILYLPLLRS
ncbi:sensor histidine kinase, partial [Paenibacillus sp. TAF58]